MARHLSIVCTMIMFAFVLGVSGCSGATNPAAYHTSTENNHAAPQSLGSWKAKASMPTARASLGVGVARGILYAIGGSDANGNSNAVEAFSHATDTWTTKASMPTARDNLAAGVVNGILYTAGGCCVNFRMLKTFEAYDPSTDTWATKASMPTARDELAASGLDGKLYAVGGHTRGVSNTVEAYNPATDTWTAKASMPTKRGELATGVAGRVIYAVGGWNSYLRGVLHTNEAFNP